MIDIVIRDCGYGEFLPLIVATETKQELYRGDRVRSREAAFTRAKTVWDEAETGNVAEFKQEHGL